MDVCFYFQLHQPYRVRRYRIFDIGSRTSYFDDGGNRETLLKVAEKCYRPGIALLESLVKQHDARFAISVSGVLLEQLAADAPDVVERLGRLVSSGNVEVLGETSHHSLSSLISPDEFAEQVKLHKATLKRLFGVTPQIFRNTELIASDAIADRVAGMGYSALLVEGATHVLGWRSPNYVYASGGTKKLRILPRNFRLTDDIAYRFSAEEFDQWPITAAKYAGWIAEAAGDVVNIFMDFETVGEHHDAATGIFDFFAALPRALKARGVRMVTPSEQLARKPIATLKYAAPVSWADTERDESAWLGNRLQLAAHERLYGLRDAVLAKGDRPLVSAWRRLTSSDHFYYMATKWWADGDVHVYFNPHATPYDAYISFMNVLRDMEQRLGSGLRAVGRKSRASKPTPKSRKAKPKAQSPKPRAQSPKPRARRK